MPTACQSQRQQLDSHDHLIVRLAGGLLAQLVRRSYGHLCRRNLEQKSGHLAMR